MRIGSTRLLHTAAAFATVLTRGAASLTAGMAHATPHKLSRNRTTLTLEPAAGAHSATAIFMHGLGDTANGWIDTVAHELAPALPQVKFILPTAATRAVTINGGMPMPAWYDIESLSGDRSREACEGIVGSAAGISDLIKAEVSAGIPPSRIMLAGFSQGGAMTLFTGLNAGETLAGLLVMSGYMPLPGAIHPTPAALRTPILMCHGDEDAVVPIAFAKDALARVKAMGVAEVEFKTYEGMPHSASAEEIADVLKFMQRLLPPVPRRV